MHRISYANVVATLALFLALGGTGVAATTMINGKTIKRGTVPADRIKARSLTGTQVDVSKLGTVPGAAHAATADAAGRAGSADTASHADAATHAGSATHADSADLLGGKSASAFMPAGHLLVGSAAAHSTAALLDYPDLGLRVEAAGVDWKLVIHNTRAAKLGLTSSSWWYNLSGGQTLTLSSSPMDAGQGEIRLIVIDPDKLTDEVLVECAEAGGMWFCRGTRS